MLSPGSTTQGTRGGGPAHKSGSRASSLPSTALNTSAPSLPTHPPRPGPRRAISGDLALSRAISGPRRAISGDLGASLARRHTCSKRKEVGGRRSRPIQSAVVAGFLAPGSSPDGCCAGQQTIGRRDDAPSGTLPPPPGYCRTSALSGGIFPSRFLGPPATPTDFPSPHLRRNHRRDCRRCAPWRLCMSRVPARFSSFRLSQENARVAKPPHSLYPQPPQGDVVLPCPAANDGDLCACLRRSVHSMHRCTRSNARPRGAVRPPGSLSARHSALCQRCSVLWGEAGGSRRRTKICEMLAASMAEVEARQAVGVGITKTMDGRKLTRKIRFTALLFFL